MILDNQTVPTTCRPHVALPFRIIYPNDFKMYNIAMYCIGQLYIDNVSGKVVFVFCFCIL